MRKFYLYSLIGGIIGVFLLPTYVFAEVGGGTNILGFGVGVLTNAFISILDMVIYLVLTISAGILWIAGLLLDTSMMYLVVKMKETTQNIPAIYTVWQTLRDLANMFLIFIILYIAIQTILGSDDYQKSITKVIIVALFINFSFFFTTLFIDGSNIASTIFYNAIVGGDTSNCLGGNAGCLTYRVITNLQLDNIMSSRDPVTWTAMNAEAALGALSRFAGIFVILSAAIVFSESLYDSSWGLTNFSSSF